MCLLRSRCTRFLLSAIADLLSTHSFTIDRAFPISSPSSRLSQTPWQAVVAAAMYSASHDESAMTFCFCDVHVIILESRKNATPIALFRSLMSPARSLSLYPHYYGLSKVSWLVAASIVSRSADVAQDLLYRSPMCCSRCLHVPIYNSDCICDVGSGVVEVS